MKRLLGSVTALALTGTAPPPLPEPEIARLVGARPDGPGCAVAIVQDGQIAVQIDHYEFRTAGRAG